MVFRHVGVDDRDFECATACAAVAYSRVTTVPVSGEGGSGGGWFGLVVELD